MVNKNLSNNHKTFIVEIIVRMSEVSEQLSWILPTYQILKDIIKIRELRICKYMALRTFHITLRICQTSQKTRVQAGRPCQIENQQPYVFFQIYVLYTYGYLGGDSVLGWLKSLLAFHMNHLLFTQFLTLLNSICSGGVSCRSYD